MKKDKLQVIYEAMGAGMKSKMGDIGVDSKNLETNAKSAIANIRKLVTSSFEAQFNDYIKNPNNTKDIQEFNNMMILLDTLIKKIVPQNPKNTTKDETQNVNQ